jgi:hypothetical protein
MTVMTPTPALLLSWRGVWAVLMLTVAPGPTADCLMVVLPLYRRGGARQLFPPLLRSSDITEPGKQPQSAS